MAGVPANVYLLVSLIDPIFMQYSCDIRNLRRPLFYIVLF